MRREGEAVEGVVLVEVFDGFVDAASLQARLDQVSELVADEGSGDERTAACEGRA